MNWNKDAIKNVGYTAAAGAAAGGMVSGNPAVGVAIGGAAGAVAGVVSTARDAAKARKQHRALRSEQFNKVTKGK